MPTHASRARALHLAAALFALHAATVAPASARQAPGTSAPGTTAPDTLAEPIVGCFQGRPRPHCASFWIFEMQGSTTLAEPTWTESNAWGGAAQGTVDRTLVEWTLGHMWNPAPWWALGATVSVGNNARGGVTGARLRVRRWLTPARSASLEAGLARSTAYPRVFETGSGPSVGLRLDSRDDLSLYLRYDRIEVVHPDFGDPRFSTSSPHEYVRLGAGLGGRAALVGTGVVALSVAAAWTIVSRIGT